MLSAPTACAHTAASVGAETWFIVAGQGWPQLGTSDYPWYPRARTFASERLLEWDEVMSRLAAELAAFADK